MTPRFCAASAVSAARLGLAFLSLIALALPTASRAAPAPGFLALPGHIPAAALASAQKVSALDARQPVSLALTLPLHHQAELDDLLRGLSDPKDPRFGQFLSPEGFAARFSPTPAEYARVTAYAKSVGLTVTNTHPNRTLLDVSGSTSVVERAFGLHLSVYQSQMDGRIFFAPDADPQVPASLEGLVTGVVGLDNASLPHPHMIQKKIPDLSSALDPYAAPLETGSGPYGGLTPTDIKAAYNLSRVPQTGSGEVLGLYELDGYTTSDVTTYENYYGLPNVPLENISVDGGVSTPGGGAGEVTLDIELQMALAPNASKIVVYEAPNGGPGIVDTYSQIATDNIAREISTSWGISEIYPGSASLQAESAAFRQMAAQGQSIFAASADSGAYDDHQHPTTLSVDDPASDPYMVGVGGTSLTTSGAGGSYNSETTWNGSGGGISAVWGIPSYQAGVVGSTASKGSTTFRNVPDVSLDADPNTGYSIYYGGGFTIFGGTSCAAPLWAAFTALVNQKRAELGSGPLGFANPAIYRLAASSAYANDFHDIADGSTNLFYPAVTGYDDATGWGTFNGANLLNDLSGASAVLVAPTTPSGLTATPTSTQIALSWTGSEGAASYTVYRGTAAGMETLLQSGLTSPSFTDTGTTSGHPYFYQVAAVNTIGTSQKSNEASATLLVPQFLGNSGFENGSARPAPWVATPGVINNSPKEPAHGGAWYAWLDGYGITHTDTLAQTVTLPANVTTATLGFYLHIDSAERGTVAHDILKVQIRNSSGTVLATLATYSNLNAARGYSLKTFNLLPYKGQTIQLYFTGTENSSLPTSFVLDDCAVSAL